MHSHHHHHHEIQAYDMWLLNSSTRSRIFVNTAIQSFCWYHVYESSGSAREEEDILVDRKRNFRRTSYE